MLKGEDLRTACSLSVARRLDESKRNIAMQCIDSVEPARRVPLRLRHYRCLIVLSLHNERGARRSDGNFLWQAGDHLLTLVLTVVSEERWVGSDRQYHRSQLAFEVGRHGVSGKDIPPASVAKFGRSDSR